MDAWYENQPGIHQKTHKRTMSNMLLNNRHSPELEKIGK